MMGGRQHRARGPGMGVLETIGATGLNGLSACSGREPRLERPRRHRKLVARRLRPHRASQHPLLSPSMSAPCVGGSCSRMRRTTCGRCTPTGHNVTRLTRAARPSFDPASRGGHGVRRWTMHREKGFTIQPPLREGPAQGFLNRVSPGWGFGGPPSGVQHGLRARRVEFVAQRSGCDRIRHGHDSRAHPSAR